MFPRVSLEFSFLFRDIRNLPRSLKAFRRSLGLPIVSSGQAILKGRNCTNMNWNVYLVYVWCLCVYKSISHTPLIFVRPGKSSFRFIFFPPPPPPVLLFFFLNRFFFCRHRAISLSANNTEEAMWEFIFPTSLQALPPPLFFSLPSPPQPSTKHYHSFLSLSLSSFYPHCDLYPTPIRNSPA